MADNFPNMRTCAAGFTTGDFLDSGEEEGGVGEASSAKERALRRKEKGKKHLSHTWRAANASNKLSSAPGVTKNDFQDVVALMEEGRRKELRKERDIGSTYHLTFGQRFVKAFEVFEGHGL